MLKAALFARNGERLPEDHAHKSTLKFYFDLPSEFTLNHKPIYVQFKGWAASFDDSEAVVKVTHSDGKVEYHGAINPRPDVKRHFESEGKSIGELCGFDFQVAIPQEEKGSHKITVEIYNDNFESGPQVFEAQDFQSIQWPQLASAQDVGEQESKEKSRGNYKDTWNAVSADENMAKIAVAGYSQESEFDRTAQFTLDILQGTVGIHRDDVVLEIGCGVARMARVLSPLCQKWIGCDVSENMIDFAKTRSDKLTNVEFVALNGWDLAPIDDASVDVVYCTIVFMHLDEWDRFNYICEAMRILKPGGRLYVDNFNLQSKQGWDFFMKNMLDYHPLQRPSNISKSSTPQELVHYLTKAGFSNIHFRESDEMWINVWGSKD